MTPEARARQTIDALLMHAGWHVCDVANANIHAGTGVVKGVAIREFPLNAGHGFADYLLYVNGKACGVIEAKEAGATLSGVAVLKLASSLVSFFVQHALNSKHCYRQRRAGQRL